MNRLKPDLQGVASCCCPSLGAGVLLAGGVAHLGDRHRRRPGARGQPRSPAAGARWPPASSPSRWSPPRPPLASTTSGPLVRRVTLVVLALAGLAEAGRRRAASLLDPSRRPRRGRRALDGPHGHGRDARQRHRLAVARPRRGRAPAACVAAGGWLGSAPRRGAGSARATRPRRDRRRRAGPTGGQRLGPPGRRRRPHASRDGGAQRHLTEWAPSPAATAAHGPPRTTTTTSRSHNHGRARDPRRPRPQRRRVDGRRHHPRRVGLACLGRRRGQPPRCSSSASSICVIGAVAGKVLAWPATAPTTLDGPDTPDSNKPEVGIK